MAPSVQLVSDAYALGIPEGLMGQRIVQGVGFGGGGLALLIAIIGFLPSIYDPGADLEPYVRVMQPLAREHGRDVEVDPKHGLGFVSVTEGPRIEVMVQPRGAGMASIWVDSPGRLRLLFIPLRDDTAADDPEWRRVGAREGWVLRAELPSAARAFTEEPALAAELAFLMSIPEVRAVRHDHSGMEIIADLPPPQDMRRFVHSALNVSRRLRRLNG